MSVNIIGIFDPNSPLIMGAAISTTSTITILAAAATNGQANDAPLFTLRNYYDADAGAGVTSTAWDLSLLHDMTAAGASPASSGIFKINSVAVLTLTNTNGTPSVMIPGAGSYPAADSLLHVWRGSAGAVAADGSSGITIEGANNTWLSILVPDGSYGAVKFGHPSDNIDTAIAGTDGTLLFDTAHVTRLRYSVGAFAFQEATTISTTAGALTLKPLTANGVRYADSAEGGTGSMNIKTVRQVVTLSGAQTSTTINIPSGAMLLGASFNVDTAVVTSSATNTWDADFTGGSTTNLVAAGKAGAQNTKANKLIVPEVASAETNIEFDAPGAETFSSGAIEVVAYYIDQTSLANA